MATPEVHGPTPGAEPGGTNAGSALNSRSNGRASGTRDSETGSSGRPGEKNIEPANVKSVTDSGEGRGNPGGGGPSAPGSSSPLLGIVEDLLKAGGKELWSATKDYVKKGDLSLFSRKNPSPQADTGKKGESRAPDVPPPEKMDPSSGSSPSSKGTPGGSGAAAPRVGGDGQPASSSGSASSSKSDSGPSPNPSASTAELSGGDLARVGVGNSVVWARVTGPASGTDDYKGRLAHPALGMPEGAPVTFAQRHVLGRVGEAPEDPTPQVPEGISGKRVRENPGGQDGPLPPRF